MAASARAFLSVLNEYPNEVLKKNLTFINMPARHFNLGIFTCSE